MDRNPEPDLLESLRDISQAKFQSKLYSDLTILCEDHFSGKVKKFYVHKLVVCLQSKFFANACKPDSPFVEARNGIIALDDDPFLVELLLRVFYLRKLSISDEELQNYAPDLPIEESAVTCYAMLYSLADKYQALQAKVRFSGAMNHRLEAARLTIGAISIASFIRVAKTVFTTTPDSDRTLRNIVYQYTRRYFAHLMGTAQFHSEMNGVDGFWSGYVRFLSFCVRRKRICPECNEQINSGVDDILFKKGILGMWCPSDRCQEYSSLDDWNRPAQAAEIEEAVESTDHAASRKRRRESSHDGD